MRRQRGVHLLDAVLTVIAEQGLPALSVRTVAAAAGVSPAQVQYYFHTKNDLVRAGYEHAGELFRADLRALPADRLDDLVAVWLPLDERRERRARVWLAYAATAAVDADLAVESVKVDAELREWLAAALAECAVPDEGTVAAQLLALIDGVTLQALALPMADRPALVARTLTPFLARMR